jgi:hypothetical protein
MQMIMRMNNPVTKQNFKHDRRYKKLPAMRHTDAGTKKHEEILL